MANKELFGKVDPSRILFRPPDITRLTHRLLKIRRKEKELGIVGYPFYVPALDEVMKPMRGNELVTILASTSHYKTGMMTFMARSMSRDLHRIKYTGEDGEKQRIFFFVTWEDSIEKLCANDLSFATQISVDEMEDGSLTDEQMKTMEEALNDRAGCPLYVIGHSERAIDMRPRVTLDDVAAAIMICLRELPDNVEIGGIFLDYLQRMAPKSKSTSIRVQVADNVETCKDMSLSFACPVFLGCQAKRPDFGRNIKIPTRFDGLETSNIEQSSDRLLALYMPKFDYPLLELLPQEYVRRIDGTVPTHDTYVTQDLLIIEGLKQKRGATGFRVPLRVNFDYNHITPL